MHNEIERDQYRNSFHNHRQEMINKNLHEQINLYKYKYRDFLPQHHENCPLIQQWHRREMYESSNWYEDIQSSIELYLNNHIDPSMGHDLLMKKTKI